MELRAVSMAATVCLLLLLVCLTRVYLVSPDDPGELVAAQRRSVVDRFLETEGVCSDVQVFMKPAKKPQPKIVAPLKKHGVNETSLIGAMLLLLIVSTLVSLADVLKEKRSRRAPGSADEKCSLAEFANMRKVRRESSLDWPKPSRAPGLFRFESVGSAFSRLRRDSSNNVAQQPSELRGTDTPNTPPVVVTRAPLKLLGARPSTMLRRSSFPASQLADDHQRRRSSVDSEDDSSPDVGHRRVRIIRRH